MSSSLRKSFLLLCVAGLLICDLLFVYFPAVPKSILGWGALLFVGLTVWFVLEWLGTTMLGSQFFARLSRPMRILLGIPTLAAIMILAVILGQFVQRFSLSF